MGLPKATDRNIFDHIASVTTKKDGGYYNSLTQDERKTYSLFLINRMLSADSSYASVCHFISTYMGKASDEVIRRMMILSYPSHRPNLKSKV